ncbi:sensor histidine kinase [Actinorhabdospora filicis]|nr:histidine kinase [Actinorhabdospora filicis]
MRRRRNARDWAVDLTAFVLAALFGLFLAGTRVDEGALPDPSWLFTLDQIAGVLGCAALWLRRRWPVGLAFGLIVLSAFSELVSGALLVALFTVAVHERLRTTIAAFAAGVAAGGVYAFLRPEPQAATGIMLGASLALAAVGWGLFVHHRRRLLESLRERARRAEEEAGMRAERARRDTRDAIAREIHDVLGHRLSLLSLHAGALEFRPDAPAADVSRAAGVIRENAHLALQDLREVIGVLRAPVGELPTPGIGDLARLAAETVDAGTPVDLRVAAEGLPDTTGRTVYRVVQEALTNARKHAPGAPVEVVVDGAVGEGLGVEVSNPLTGGPGGEGGGAGLIGLAERVALAGGELTHGAEGGRWRVAARLPWPS